MSAVMSSVAWSFFIWANAQIQILEDYNMATKKNTPETTEVVESAAKVTNPERDKENMAAAETALDTAIAAYNTALATEDVVAMREAEAAIAKAAQEFAEAAECATFAICRADEHPLRKAAEIHSYRVIAHKAVREDKILTGFEKTDREKPIDLERLAKQCGLPTLWTHTTERLNQIMTLRVAKNMGATATELKDISKSYFMSRASGEMEAGGTPTSNTQMTKALQSICDMILGVDAVRVNNHDLAYIENAHTKKGRGKIAVGTANHSFMRRLVLDVLHRCVTDGVYEVEFKKAKTA